MRDPNLSDRLTRVDDSIAIWERRLAAGEAVAAGQAVDAALAAASALARAYIEAEGSKPVPAEETDLLETFRILVKGDPGWNAIRENLRELVYYRNCIALGRRDALPSAPERMAIRLARHVYLYVKTRCEREGRL
jgi:hypothetical protein